MPRWTGAELRLKWLTERFYDRDGEHKNDFTEPPIPSPALVRYE